MHCESDFKDFPGHNEEAHVNRWDNMNSVIRAFGVDGHNTRKKFCTDVRNLFDDRFTTFTACGTGSQWHKMPIFCFDVAEYLEELKNDRRMVLSDRKFKERVRMARNGESCRSIHCWYQSKKLKTIMDMATWRKDRASTLYLVLSPNGNCIVPIARNQRRVNMEDIYKCLWLYPR